MTEAKEPKTYTQDEMDEIIAKVKNSVKVKTEKNYISKGEYDKLQSDYAKLQSDFTISQKQPAIKKQFLEMGGKAEVFNDYFKKHQEQLLESAKLNKTIKETIKTTPYAFDNQTNKDKDITNTQDNDIKGDGNLFIK